MEQRFNRLVVKLKELNYSTTELLDLNILKAHEQILYHECDMMLLRKENLQMHGIDLKDDKYFNQFFDGYEKYFKTGTETVSEKIEAKPLLKG